MSGGGVRGLAFATSTVFVTIALEFAERGFAALITPNTLGALSANGVGRPLLVTMDADQMTTKIVLAAEGTTTVGVGADMGLQTVRVVGGHVSLKIVGPSEGYDNRSVTDQGNNEMKLTSRADLASVLLAGIKLIIGGIRRAGSGRGSCRCGHGWSDGGNVAEEGVVISKGFAAPVRAIGWTIRRSGRKPEACCYAGAGVKVDCDGLRTTNAAAGAVFRPGIDTNPVEIHVNGERGVI